MILLPLFVSVILNLRNLENIIILDVLEWKTGKNLHW